MSEPQMTLPDAARIARTTEANIRAALDSGNLSDLRLSSVQAWRRAQVAAQITPRGQA